MTGQAPTQKRPTHDVLTAVVVHELSRAHIGRRNGVTAVALAARVGVSERTLRLLISKAREDGVAIAGLPETGYYIACTHGELSECCAFLRARAMHSLRLEARLRKISLPELLGQLHLKT